MPCINKSYGIPNTWYPPPLLSLVFPFTLHPFNLSPREILRCSNTVKFLKSPPAIPFPSHKGSRLPTVILSLKNTRIPIGQRILKGHRNPVSRRFDRGKMNILSGRIFSQNVTTILEGKYFLLFHREREREILYLVFVKIIYKLWREIVVFAKMLKR